MDVANYENEYKVPHTQPFTSLSGRSWLDEENWWETQGLFTTDFELMWKSVMLDKCVSGGRVGFFFYV